MWTREATRYVLDSGDPALALLLILSRQYLTQCVSVCVTLLVSQRPGAFAIYLEPWHPDVFDFLDMRKNHGSEEKVYDTLIRKVGEWVGGQKSGLCSLGRTQVGIRTRSYLIWVPYCVTR